MTDGLAEAVKHDVHARVGRSKYVITLCSQNRRMFPEHCSGYRTLRVEYPKSPHGKK